MSEGQASLPIPSAAHVNAATATLMVPPRPALPPRDPQRPVTATAHPQPPPLPPGWKVPAAASRRSPRLTALSRRVRAGLSEPRVLLGLYVAVLALIALWPSPVDGGARPFLRLLERAVPMLTYARVEFGANILLFVPLGVLLALILQPRYLIAPIAVVATVTIESIQALMIDKRTPSVMDIIANLTGACIGLLIVAFVEWRRARRVPAST